LPAVFDPGFSAGRWANAEVGTWQGTSEKLISLPKSEERRNKYARLKRRVKRIHDPTLLGKDEIR